MRHQGIFDSLKPAGSYSPRNRAEATMAALRAALLTRLKMSDMFGADLRQTNELLRGLQAKSFTSWPSQQSDVEFLGSCDVTPIECAAEEFLAARSLTL